MNDNDNFVIIEVTGEKSRVVELLNRIAAVNKESWRTVKKRRVNTDYIGRACIRMEAPTTVKG